MKPALALCLFVLLTLSGCDRFESLTGPNDNTRTSLSGRVTTASTGAPYYPASVALFEAGVTDYRYESVDSNGNYRFGSLKPGRYLLVLTLGQGAFTHEGTRETIDISAGPNVRDFVIR